MKKNLTLVAAVLSIALPMAAQNSAPPPPEAILKEVLNLSDAQVAGLQTLEHARAAAVASLLPQLQSAQEQLQLALSSPDPDASAVGHLVLMINGLQKQVAQVQQTVKDNFSALLSDDQKSRVGAIHATQMALAAAGALDALGL